MAHRAAVEAGREHLVLPGETLSEVAERYGLGLSRLAQANGIQPPYQVFAGQIIILPRPDPAARPVRTETVRRGDTLAAIAARHKLKLGDIVAANPDLDPDRIRPGQTVRLPGDIAMPPAPAMSAEEVETVRRASLMKPPSLSGDGFHLARARPGGEPLRRQAGRNAQCRHQPRGPARHARARRRERHRGLCRRSPARLSARCC